MKKILVLLSLIVVVLTGCQTSWSYTFTVNTGENVEVKLDTTNGDKLVQDNGHFIIKNKDKEQISYGGFYFKEKVEELYKAGEIGQNAEVIEDVQQDEFRIIFYKLKEKDETQYNYFVQIDGAKTAIKVENKISEESARYVFDLLEFELNP